MNDLMEITNTDIETIIKGLDALKKADDASDLLVDIMSSVLMPHSEDPLEAERAMEKRQKERDARRAEKKSRQESAQKDIDFLKAKLTILLESRIRADTKKLSNE